MALSGAALACGGGLPPSAAVPQGALLSAEDLAVGGSPAVPERLAGVGREGALGRGMPLLLGCCVPGRESDRPLGCWSSSPGWESDRPLGRRSSLVPLDAPLRADAHSSPRARPSWEAVRLLAQALRSKVVCAREESLVVLMLDASAFRRYLSMSKALSSPAQVLFCSASRRTL